MQKPSSAANLVSAAEAERTHCWSAADRRGSPTVLSVPSAVRNTNKKRLAGCLATVRVITVGFSCERQGVSLRFLDSLGTGG